MDASQTDPVLCLCTYRNTALEMDLVYAKWCLQKCSHSCNIIVCQVESSCHVLHTYQTRVEKYGAKIVSHIQTSHCFTNVCNMRSEKCHIIKSDTFPCYVYYLCHIPGWDPFHRPSLFKCWCLGLAPVSHEKMESRLLYKVKLCTADEPSPVYYKHPKACPQ